MKIAVLGSATNKISKENKHLCEKIGKYLAKKNITVATGGSHGIPGLVVSSAFKAGAETEAFSPDRNEREHHLRTDNLPLKYFKNTKFIPGFTARSLAMIKNVDGVLVINGRIGTLSEFTIALEEGSDIAVLKNSGGIADHLEYIVSVAKKEFPNKVIFEVNYKKAINDLILLINQKPQ
jgi:uncharacterized protein (TIGR00725 family)